MWTKSGNACRLSYCLLLGFCGLGATGVSGSGGIATKWTRSEKGGEEKPLPLEPKYFCLEFNSLVSISGNTHRAEK